MKGTSPEASNPDLSQLLKLVESGSPGATGGLVGQINAAGGKVVVVGGDVHGGIKM